MWSSELALRELREGEFDRRRRQARRSGNPAWLWPEVPARAWAESLADMAAAIAAILRGDRAHLPGHDPLALSVAAYTSGMGPLLGWWLEQELLTTPPDIGAILAAHFRHARRRSRRVRAGSAAVIGLLASKSIAVIPLKGGHTAWTYFPDPATRPASDLDLLVPQSRTDVAQAALQKAGFACIGRNSRESSWRLAGEAREPRSVWLAHADDPWSVDLHASLDFAAGPGATMVRLDRADPFATDERSPLGDAARALRQPLQCLHLAVHAGGGLHSLTLLRMVELILVIRRDSERGTFCWNEFLEIGRLTGGLGAAYPALSMVEKLVPATIPETVLRCCRESAPTRVRTVVDKLEPYRAHRVDRSSIAEHFMWASGLSGWTRQLGSDLIPSRSIRSTYEARAYRLLRGTVSR